MPTVGSKFTIASTGNGPAQATTAYDTVKPLIESAGFNYFVTNTIWAGGATARIGLFRHPTFDPHHSRPLPLIMYAHPAVAQSYWGIVPVVDYDHLKTGSASIQDAAVSSDFRFWAGRWTAAYPTSGAPTLTEGYTTPVASPRIDFDAGNDTWDIRYMFSEYGFNVLPDNQSDQDDVIVQSRPLEDTRPGRDIGVNAAPNITAPYTFDFAAPIGGGLGVHLRFLCDGRTVDITFDSTRTYNMYDVAQEITMQAGGWIEGVVLNCLPSTEVLRVRIPPGRTPVGGITTGPPSLKLIYQDEAFFDAGTPGDALGLSFAIFHARPQAGSASTVGARSEFTDTSLPSSGWPQNRVRVGSVFYNKTRSNFATVKAFRTATNTFDTVIFDVDVTSLGSPWASSDLIDVYPYSDHQLGASADGGNWTVTVLGDPTSDITKTGASLDLVCNDIYGEARNQYVAGQGMFLMNNGFACILDVPAITGFKLGEFVANSDKPNVRGIIRGIDAGVPAIVVDTIVGSGTASLAWEAGDTVVSETNVDSPAEHGTGSQVISGVEHSTSAGRAGEGWSGRVLVTGVGTVSSADLRTVLTVDMADVGVNASIQFFPCASAGVRSKKHHLWHEWASSTGRLQQPGHRTITAEAAEFANDYRRPEVSVGFTTTDSTHVPDTETQDVDLAEWQAAIDSGEDGVTLLGSVAHWRTVNQNDPGSPDINQGHELHETRDGTMVWYVGRQQTFTESAQTAVPSIQPRICIGPTDGSII